MSIYAAVRNMQRCQVHVASYVNHAKMPSGLDGMEEKLLASVQW